MTTAQEFGCEKCFPSEAEAAYRAFPGLSSVAGLIDESHFIVRVVACAHCGQHYVSVFTELIDWKDGDDSQDRIVLPLTEQESAELVAQGERVDVRRIQALGENRRSLTITHPCGGTLSIRWWRGKLLVMPHD